MAPSADTQSMISTSPPEGLLPSVLGDARPRADTNVSSMGDELCHAMTTKSLSPGFARLPLASASGTAASLGDSGQKHDKFTLFPKLPTELRLTIWKIAVEPSIITVMGDDDTLFHTIMYVARRKLYVLGVNQESRREAQKVVQSYETMAANSAKHRNVQVDKNNLRFFIDWEDSFPTLAQLHTLIRIVDEAITGLTADLG